MASQGNKFGTITVITEMRRYILDPDVAENDGPRGFKNVAFIQ